MKLISINKSIDIEVSHLCKLYVKILFLAKVERVVQIVAVYMSQYERRVTTSGCLLAILLTSSDQLSDIGARIESNFAYKVHVNRA